MQIIPGTWYILVGRTYTYLVRVRVFRSSSIIIPGNIIRSRHPPHTPSVRAHSSPYRDKSSVVTNYDTEIMHRNAISNARPRHRPGTAGNDIQAASTQLPGTQQREENMYTYVCQIFVLLPTFLFIHNTFRQNTGCRAHQARPDTLVQVSARSVHSGARGRRSKFFSGGSG